MVGTEVPDEPGPANPTVPEPGKATCCAIHGEPNAAPCVPPQDAKEQLEQLAGALQGSEMGQDLRSSRKLQKRHHQLENESQTLAAKMAALASQARGVAASPAILEETQKHLQRWGLSSHPPVCHSPV